MLRIITLEAKSVLAYVTGKKNQIFSDAFYRKRHKKSNIFEHHLEKMSEVFDVFGKKRGWKIARFFSACHICSSVVGLKSVFCVFAVVCCCVCRT